MEVEATEVEITLTPEELAELQDWLFIAASHVMANEPQVATDIRSFTP